MNEDDPKQEDGSGKAGQRRTVLLIHGLGGTTNVWGAQVDDLSRRFTVVRVDLEGSGPSPAVSKLSVKLVDDLVALADDEGLSTLRVVGHSLGTLIAQHFTAQNPSRVVRLALFGINRAPAGTARRQALRRWAARGARRRIGGDCRQCRVCRHLSACPAKSAGRAFRPGIGTAPISGRLRALLRSGIRGSCGGSFSHQMSSSACCRRGRYCQSSEHLAVKFGGFRTR